MKQNAGMIALAVLTIFAIGVSLFSPSVYFQAKDYKMLENGYLRGESKGNISPQADEIYIIKAIQKIYGENNLEEIDMNYSTAFTGNSNYFTEMSEAGIINKKNVSGNYLFLQEEKTQKVLMLKAYIGESVFTEKHAVVQKYVSYLGLDVLDDWKEDTLGMSSQQAQLQIVFLNFPPNGSDGNSLSRDNVTLLAVAPLGYFNYENLEKLMETQYLLLEDQQ